jgi:heme/copper-type cytochrome/quinol oxidase subunit 1
MWNVHHPHAVPETRSRYALLMTERRTKWEEDNDSPLNVWAIFATAVLILFVAGLAVLFALT